MTPYMDIDTRNCGPGIALKKGARTKKETIMADGVPEPIGH